VAELGAALLCAELRIEGQLQHAEYIGSWIKLLQDDKKAFRRAASLAQKGVDWIKAGVMADEKEDTPFHHNDNEEEMEMLEAA
jgi:antirestriction protein ArdC